MRFLLTVCSFLIFTISYSQSIKGKITDKSTQKVIAGATIEVVSVKDKSIKWEGVSNASGIFSSGKVPAEALILVVRMIGYDTLQQEFTLQGSTVKDFGTLELNQVSKELDDVVVTARTSPVSQKGDTTQIAASQFKVNPDATVEDLVKKMPGITVDKAGTVTAQGEQVRKVTIDGRDFFGDDATAALRNLPADLVDKIQVFDRLSDQAQLSGIDDGNSVRALNIVTKSGLQNGQFGRLFAGYGTNDRYAAGGNISFFKKNRRISLVGNFNNTNQQNFGSQDLLGVTSSGGGGRGGFGGGMMGGRGGGMMGGGWGRGESFTVGQSNGISTTNSFGINYSDKWGTKTDISGSYFFNQSNNNNDAASNSQTFFKGPTLYSEQQNISRTENFNNRLNLRLETKIDSFQSITITPSFNFQTNNSTTGSIVKNYYSAADSVNNSTSDNISDRNGYNLRNNIIYRYTFPSNRRRSFSVGLNTTFNKNAGVTYNNSLFRYYDELGIPTDSIQDLYINNPTTGYSIAPNVEFNEPIGEKSQLQFQYRPTITVNKADQKTYSYDELDKDYTIFMPKNSNEFDNTTTSHNAGISYRWNPNRDQQFSVGAELQHSIIASDRVFPTTANFKQSFTNVLPSLMLRKKLNARNNIRLFYRARTNFPSVNQLQDVVNLSNPLRLSAGTPDLEQSFNHMLGANYTFTNTQKGTGVFVNTFLQATQDYITNAVYIAQQDSVIFSGDSLLKGAQFTRPLNLNGYKSARAMVTYSTPLNFIKNNLSVTGGLSYSTIPGLSNYVKTTTDNYTFNTGVALTSNISQYVDYNISYNANFSNAVNSLTNTSNKYIDQNVGVNFNLLSKKGWFLQNDLSYRNYSGMSDGFNQSFTLWNVGIGKKFLKNNAGELKISVFDLLKQNQSIFRTVSENYIEDSQSRVLQQYFMLTFTYNLKNFGTPAPRREWQGGGGMGPGGPGGRF